MPPANGRATLAVRGLPFLTRRRAVDLGLMASAGVLFVAGCFYLPGFDETDNLLGGQLIADGQWPYRGFFSHHMPGMYLLSALVQTVSGPHVFFFRLAFNLLAFCLLLANAALLRRLVGSFSARLYLLLLPLGHLVGFGQMALAESFTPYVFTAALVLVLFSEPQRLFTPRVLALVSVLLFLVPFFSLSYVFVTAVLYLVLAVRYWSTQRPWRIRKVGVSLATLGLPFVLTFVVLLATGTLRRFIFDVITFNATYYAPLVGQPGGSVARTLLATVRNSVDQLGTLARHVGDPAYSIQLLHVIAYLLAGAVLWQMGKRIEALLFLSLLLFIDPLVNIFNPPAIVSSLGDRSQHSLMYTSVALTAACIAIPHMWARWSGRWRPGVVAVRTAVTAYLLIVTVSLGMHTANSLSSVFVRHDSVNVYTFAEGLPKALDVTVVNQLTGPGDHAWIGPANFRSQLYMTAERASAYTFFLPWQDACADCRSELLDGFATQEPKVIVWRSQRYLGAPYTYHAEIRRFLEERYFEVSDPRLEHFHFLERDRATLTRKLAQLGYRL
jgi:hypothetical protein